MTCTDTNILLCFINIDKSVKMSFGDIWVYRDYFPSETGQWVKGRIHEIGLRFSPSHIRKYNEADIPVDVKFKNVMK
jgi:hypothetical protein